ncbi:glycosyltransferase [Shewanella sp. ALD9]|uniref:glycosyltransferase n=1 Tax=Shewanella sp. ALD9 TaxID=2058330 RepID=UPI000C33F5C9|nr:glycosyltransferase [Shewanella sp. ALD9]PKH31896.1 hypothetical protein CXF88_08300 [Shewanella sp. ALD9]
MYHNFLINSLQGGGTEKVCKIIANGLAEKGYIINIYIFDDRDELAVQQCHTNVRLFFLGKASSIKSIPSLFSLVPQLAGGSILVFNHEYALVLLLIKLFLRKDLKIISRMNNTFSITVLFKSKKYRFFVTLLMKLFYKKMDFYIYQSKGIKDDLVRNYYVTGPSELIPNPIGLPTSILNKKSNSKHQLLYVGRLVKQKNVIDILKAVKFISISNPNVILIIVGDGPEKERLKLFCLENDIVKHVSFVGKVLNVAQYYSEANLTILSSFNEGFPNVLLESISYNTPVVSYDCPSGPSEIIINGVNGFLVKHLDQNDLQEKIISALSYNWKEKELLESISKFNCKNIISKYETVLNNI